MASQSSKRAKAAAENPLKAQNFHNDIVTLYYGKKSRIRPAVHKRVNLARCDSLMIIL